MLKRKIRLSDLKQHTKGNVQEVKNDIALFLKFLDNNKILVVLSLFFLLLAYGMKLFNHSFSIDTENIINNYDYVMGSWLAMGRYGNVLTKALLKLSPFNVYIANYLMACIWLLTCCFSGFMLSSFAKGEDAGEKFSVVCAFPALFVTAPLFAEQFHFTLQAFEVSLGIFLCFVAVFCITKWTLRSSNVLYLLLGIFCMAWGFAIYQSIVSLYMSAVLGGYMLLYAARREEIIRNEKNYFLIAVPKHLAAFAAGFLLYTLGNMMLNPEYGGDIYVSGKIAWGVTPIGEIIGRILWYGKSVLVGDGMFYTRLYVVVVVLFMVYALICLLSKAGIVNRVLMVLAGAALVLSPFFLSVYLGQALIPRMQFSYQFVTAFGVFFFLYLLKGKGLQLCGIVLALTIAFNQGTMVAALFYTDYCQYEAEVLMATKVSMRIDQYYNENQDYPVAYVGAYNPGNEALQIRGETIGRSFFEWDNGTPFQSNARISEFMATLGMEYTWPTQEQVDMAKEFAETMPCWPSADSVQLHDGVIIVKLSDDF